MQKASNTCPLEDVLLRGCEQRTRQALLHAVVELNGVIEVFELHDIEQRRKQLLL